MAPTKDFLCVISFICTAVAVSFEIGVSVDVPALEHRCKQGSCAAAVRKQLPDLCTGHLVVSCSFTSQRTRSAVAARWQQMELRRSGSKWGGVTRQQ
jgi:hypothetical protein